MRAVAEGTDQEARSLLQKAIRRGWPDVAVRVARYLCDIGDRAWLRGRLGVLLFEEAWICAHLIDFPGRGEEPLEFVRRLAVAPKNKDAAGMGALAHLVAEGRPSNARNTMRLKPPAAVVAALARPGDFFAWASGNAPAQESLRAVEAAALSHRRAGWPWDKAFAVAGAFLAVRSPERLEKDLDESRAGTGAPVDLLLAIDRHTRAGREALRAVAPGSGVSFQVLSWASFFFWSGQVINSDESEWWKAEMRFRIDSLGASVSAARDAWEISQERFCTQIAMAAEALRERVGLRRDTPIGNGIVSDQLRLF